MDASRAVLALDELAKWRERRRRVEERLRTMREQRQSLLGELETVRARIAELQGLLASGQGAPVAPPSSTPPPLGVLR